MQQSIEPKAVEQWVADFTPKPLYDYLEVTARAYSSNLATDFMGKKMTYGELGAKVEKAALGLANLGVKKGDRVGICLPNTPFYPVFYFAILRLGAVVVNFNPLYVEREIAFQARDAGVRLMITLDLKLIYDKVEAVRREGAIDKVIVCPFTSILPQPKRLLFGLFKGKELAKVKADHTHVLMDDLLASTGVLPQVSIDPQEDIAVLQYTGGTTGVPKGAMLTHANISANMQQMHELFYDTTMGEERMLCVLPFFHVFAMTVVQNLSVMLAAEMVLMPRFEIKMLLDAVKRTKPTLFAGVPTLYTAINNAPETKSFDLSSIRLCISGGAPLPVEVKQTFEKLTGCTLVEGYGLTETSPIACANPLDGSGKDGSIGVPLPGTKVVFRDLDDPSKDVADGEKGELCVVAPQVMKGYWQRPEETEKTLEDGKILHTGDVGYRDKDGFIYLVDRIKDLIISSGYNVYPRVIEEALYQHDGVQEAIVIAIEDAYRGQAPKAFVKLREGHEVSEEELKTFLAGHISKIEMPKSIEFRDELPKTMVGKLSKKELVEEEREKALAKANA